MTSAPEARTTATLVPDQSPECIVTLSVDTDLKSLESAWRLLESRAPCHAFQSFDWMSAWMRTVGAAQRITPVIVTGRDSGGDPLFLLPLGLGRAFGVRTVSWLGGDHADLKLGLFDEAFLTSLTPSRWAQIWHAVRSLLPAHDLITLHDQPERIGDHANPFIRKGSIRQPHQTHATRLGHDWEDFYKAKRGGNVRRVERSRRRKLEAEGKVELLVAREPADVMRVMDALFTQKGEALAQMGVRAPFADPAARAFYLSLARRSYPHGIGHVSALTLDGAPVSTHWGLVHNGRFHYLLASYDKNHHSASPGRLHLNELLRWSIAEGLEFYDFGVGDLDYKFDWCDQHMSMFDTLIPATLAGRAAALALTAKLHAKYRIKSSKRLWPLAQAVRARLRAPLLRRRS
jgi:CelD/BcsL family acetyltransferase involved in cellulose biosynthesis